MVSSSTALAWIFIARYHNANFLSRPVDKIIFDSANKKTIEVLKLGHKPMRKYVSRDIHCTQASKPGASDDGIGVQHPDNHARHFPVDQALHTWGLVFAPVCT